MVAAALAGAADAIVTGDSDLLADEALRRWLAERDVEVLTPVVLLERLGDRDGATVRGGTSLGWHR